MLPAIVPKRLTGAEPLVAPDGKQISHLIDFWQWAYSDLVSNAERGALAEYIVACALGISHTERVAWDKYDLLSNDGIAIEVKTSGYLQTWEQTSLSKPVFGIQPTHAWNSITNEYANEKKRQSDIYVFCLHKHTEQATVNPLDIAQWTFYLMPTSVINEKFGPQKTVSLASLIKAGAEQCTYDMLSKRIFELIKPD